MLFFKFSESFQKLNIKFQGDPGPKGRIGEKGNKVWNTKKNQIKIIQKLNWLKWNIGRGGESGQTGIEGY